MTIPFVEDCAGYHLFGGSEAASVANLVNPAKPLIKVGTPTYPVAGNYAQINFNAERQGFRTTDSFPNRGTTAILMATWPRNAADTAFAPLQIKPISWDAGAIYLLWISGTDHQFITGSGTGVSDALTNNRRPSFNQDNDIGTRVTGPNRYALMAVVDTGTEARMTLQEGYQLKQFTGTSGPSVAASPIFFGGQGFLGDAVMRLGAAAYFTRALSFAEISAVWQAMQADFAARVPLLSPLSLSASTMAEGSAPGTVVGAVRNRTEGAAISLANDAGGRFAIAGADIVAGSVATDFETATSHAITVRETLAGSANSPRDTALTITVTNVLEQPSLSALTLPASPQTGTTIAISGATAGSTITGTLPSGWTLDSAARTITIAPSAAYGSQSWTLIETLADSPNSPRTSTGSSVVVPSISFLTGPLDSRITFTRASAATFVGSNGLIQSAAANVPRFDFDPATLQPRGLLIEEQRTNLLLRSEEFDNASWSKSNATVTANASADPAGGSGADFLVANTTNALHATFPAGLTITAGVRHTLSVFAKANGYNFLGLSISNGATTAGNETLQIFNLSNGTLGSGNFNVSPEAATITALGNGWYRCSITWTVTTTTLNPAIYVMNGNTHPRVGFAGNNTSGILIWGAQLEAGAFASSYIPTAASTVTRIADQASMTGANFSSWFNASEGTFVFEGDSAYGAGGMVGSTPTTGALLYGNGNAVRTFNGTNFITSPNTYVNNAVFKAALGYSAAGRAIVLNGGAVVSDANLIQTPTAILLGGAFGGGFLNGHIRRLTYYPTRLPNAQLQGLTA